MKGLKGERTGKKKRKNKKNKVTSLFIYMLIVKEKIHERQTYGEEENKKINK
jgi:hypothetical protein